MVPPAGVVSKLTILLNRSQNEIPFILSRSIVGEPWFSSARTIVYKYSSMMNIFLHGAPGWTRTSGLRFRKPLLYPAELQGQIDLASRIHFLTKPSKNKERSGFLFDEEILGTNCRVQKTFVLAS